MDFINIPPLLLSTTFYHLWYYIFFLFQEVGLNSKPLESRFYHLIEFCVAIRYLYSENIYLYIYIFNILNIVEYLVLHYSKGNKQYNILQHSLFQLNITIQKKVFSLNKIPSLHKILFHNTIVYQFLSSQECNTGNKCIFNAIWNFTHKLQNSIPM